MFMHAPVMTLLFYALFFAGLGWLIWRSMRDEQPTKPRESSRAPPRDAAPRGSIELADDQSLRRFVPPSFDSPRDLGAMYANPQVTYADATTEIRGLVDESTAYVGASRDAIRDGWYDHTFYLAAWAEKGEAIRRRELHISRPIPDKTYRDDIGPGKVVRMRVFLDEDRRRAIVDALLSRDEPNGDFATIAAELREPIRRMTEEFGTLEYDRERRTFDGQGEWRGRPVKVSFDAISLEDLERLLPVLVSLWAEQERWQTEVEAGLVDELLEGANDWAHDMDDPPMTAEQFLARLRLETVSIDDRGGFTFWFDDGDVFSGHVVEACGTLDSGISLCVYEG